MLKNIAILAFISCFVFYFIYKLNYQKIKIYNGNKWQGYRIGDLFFNPSKVQNNNPKSLCYPKCVEHNYHSKYYPTSVAACYEQTAQKVSDLDSIKKCIHKKQFKPLRFNPYNTCVLHIRVGDILCGKTKNNKYSKNSDEFWWSSFEIFCIKNNVKNIHIIAGSHNDICISESIEYLKSIEKKLSKNFKVVFDTGNSPDKDLLLINQVQFFASTGGGYGKLLKEIVTSNNGIVYS